MARQLPLDRDKITSAYSLAAQSVASAQKFINRHSTYSIEKASLRLLDVQGEHRGKSIAHWVVESLTKDQLRLGAAYWWGRALSSLPKDQKDPDELIKKILKKKLNWEELPKIDIRHIKKLTQSLAEKKIAKLSYKIERPPRRHSLACYFPADRIKKIPWFLKEVNEEKTPLIRVDAISSKPFEEGLSQKDETKHLELIDKYKKNRGWAYYHMHGLNVPEMAVCLTERKVSGFSYSGLLNSFLRKVDLKRSLVDQYFVYLLSATSKVYWHQPFSDWVESCSSILREENLLAIMMLQEQFLKRSNIAFDRSMMAYPLSQNNIDEKNFLNIVGFNQLVRESFPQSDIASSWNEQSDSLGWLASSLTDQNHWEFSFDVLQKRVNDLQQKKDFALLLKNELDMQTHGRIARLASGHLENVNKCLYQIHRMNIWKSFENKKLDPTLKNLPTEGGQGVFQKSFRYWNPVTRLLEEKQCQESESY